MFGIVFKEIENNKKVIMANFPQEQLLFGHDVQSPHHAEIRIVNIGEEEV